MARALMALSPAALNFLSGLCAGAGINMLTSVATDPTIASVSIIADSTCWVVAAGLLTAVAATVADVQAALDQATAGLTHQEITGTRAQVVGEHRIRLRTLGTAAVAALLLAVLLVPNVIGWRRLWCAAVTCAGHQPAPAGSPSPGRGNRQRGRHHRPRRSLIGAPRLSSAAEELHMTGDDHRRAFLLLHGWQNRRPERHWQHLLATALREAGHEVHHPQLPDPDRPRPGAWTEAIAGVLGAGERRWTVICHSLSCVAWMHLSLSLRRPVERLLFVAPPSISFLAGTPELREFKPPQQSFDAVLTSSRQRPRLVCAEADPYCEPPAYQIYGDAFAVDVIPHGGHLDMVAGLGEWPELLDWCERGRTPIRCHRVMPAHA